MQDMLINVVVFVVTFHNLRKIEFYRIPTILNKEIAADLKLKLCYPAVAIYCTVRTSKVSLQASVCA